MNETPTTNAAEKKPAENYRDKRIMTCGETTPRKAAQAAYYLLDSIRDTAEQMKATPEEAEANDLQIDIAGWAEKILTLAELAQNEVFPLME